MSSVARGFPEADLQALQALVTANENAAREVEGALASLAEGHAVHQRRIEQLEGDTRINGLELVRVQNGLELLHILARGAIRQSHILGVQVHAQGERVHRLQDAVKDLQDQVAVVDEGIRGIERAQEMQARLQEGAGVWYRMLQMNVDQQAAQAQAQREAIDAMRVQRDADRVANRVRLEAMENALQGLRQQEEVAEVQLEVVREEVEEKLSEAQQAAIFGVVCLALPVVMDPNSVLSESYQLSERYQLRRIPDALLGTQAVDRGFVGSRILGGASVLEAVQELISSSIDKKGDKV